MLRSGWQHALRRHTTSGLYIPELDGLRFVAIFSVYVYHIAGDVLRHTPSDAARNESFIFRLTQHLNIGVPLFFVISGMILGLPFARHRLGSGPAVSLRKYLLRRVTRLEPPYIMALLAFLALKLAGSRGLFTDLLPHFAASLAYLHNLIYGTPSQINFVAWSLEVEVQFYLVAPLLACLFAVPYALLRRGLCASLILCAAAVAQLQPLGSLTGLTLVGNLHYFLGGMLLAEAFVVRPPSTNCSYAWDLVSLVGWPCFFIALVEFPNFNDAHRVLMIILLYTAALYGSVSRKVFSTPWIATVGGMCYSIYLLHNYIIAAVGFQTESVGIQFSFESRLLIQILLLMPFVLGCSTIYYCLVERPCMRPDWPTRVAARLRISKGRYSAAASAG